MMNLHSSESEGNNTTLWSAKVGRDVLEDSSWGRRNTTDLYSLLK